MVNSKQVRVGWGGFQKEVSGPEALGDHGNRTNTCY